MLTRKQFILLSPCAFLAQIYMILPRLATWLDCEDCLYIGSRKIVRIFVWSDVITFWAQAGGGGLTASSGTMAIIGYWVSHPHISIWKLEANLQKVTLGGLIVQLISFSIFTVLLVLFGRRL